VVQSFDDSNDNENPQKRHEARRCGAFEIIGKTLPIMRTKLRRTGVDVMSDHGRELAAKKPAQAHREAIKPDVAVAQADKFRGTSRG
jgi:hypothetical protein